MSWGRERRLKVARYLSGRHGAKVVILGRFVSFLRTYAAFLACASRMRGAGSCPPTPLAASSGQ